MLRFAPVSACRPELRDQHPHIRCLLQAEIIDLLRIKGRLSPSVCIWVVQNIALDPANSHAHSLANLFFFSRSLLPTISSNVRNPSLAIYSRRSWAMNFMKFMTYSGLPLNFFLSSGFLGADADGACVQIAHPHHHAAHWLPAARLPKPNSSAPSMRGDRHVPAAHQLAVGLDPDADRADPFMIRRLVRLRHARAPTEAPRCGWRTCSDAAPVPPS